MAAVTERLRFLTNVYVLPMRTPFHGGQGGGTAAVLSGDRVALGVGMGWMAEEFALLEQPFASGASGPTRCSRCSRKLWAGGWVEHHGEFYDFDRLEMTPGARPACPSTSAASPSRRCGGPPATTAGSATCTRTDELAEICAKLRRYRGRARPGRRAVRRASASCKDAWDLDGYRRLADVGVTHLLTLPWVLLRRLHRRPRRPRRRHPPLRRRHHRPLLTGSRPRLSGR